MNDSSLTIILDKDLDSLLTKASQRSGKNKSIIAQEALKRQLRVGEFEELRKKVVPFAQSQGYMTDEDFFSEIS